MPERREPRRNAATRRRPATPRTLSAGLATALALGWTPAAEAAPTYADLAPVFAEHCTVCHRGEEAPLGLRLDTYEGLIRGSENGAVVDSGAPGKSELVRRLRGTSRPRMPLTGPPYLPEATVARVERWIEAGAPRGAQPPPPAPAPLPAPGRPAAFGDVAPTLVRRCVECHADGGRMGPPPEGVRLATHAQVLAGGDRVVVVPGSPEASELVRRIRGQALPRMPLDGPPYLRADEIRDVGEWVARGAPDGAGVPAPIPVGRRVRLHGTLTGRWALDGLPLVTGPETRLRASPGEYARVRGTVEPGGAIRATEIRGRDPDGDHRDGRRRRGRDPAD